MNDPIFIQKKDWHERWISPKLGWLDKQEFIYLFNSIYLLPSPMEIWEQKQNVQVLQEREKSQKLWSVSDTGL